MDFIPSEVMNTVKAEKGKQCKILDLGCGKKKRKNAIGFDIVPSEGVDVVGNFDDPLPFQDNEFDVVYMDNVLEHAENPGGLLREVWRITKKTGFILIEVPYYNSPTGVADPTHKNYFHYQTFDYFEKSHPYHFYYDFGFKILRKNIVRSRIGSFFPNKILLRLSNYIGNLIISIRIALQPVK